MRKSNYAKVRRIKNFINAIEVIGAILIGVVFSLYLFGPQLSFKDSEETTKEVTQIEGVGRRKTINANVTYATAVNNETEPVETETAEPEDEADVEVEAEPEIESEAEETAYEEVQQYDSETKEFQDRCRLTYAESGLEDEIGQVAVAATILNRQYSSEFHADGNFYNVMNNGFSSVHDGEIFIMTSNPHVLYYEDVPERTIRATERALNGEDPTEQLLWEEAVRLGLDPEVYAAGGAKYFYNPNACSEDALAERANIKCKVQIGNHVFYKVWDQ